MVLSCRGGGGFPGRGLLSSSQSPARWHFPVSPLHLPPTPGPRGGVVLRRRTDPRGASAADASSEAGHGEPRRRSRPPREKAASSSLCRQLARGPGAAGASPFTLGVCSAAVSHFAHLPSPRASSLCSPALSRGPDSTASRRLAAVTSLVVGLASPAGLARWPRGPGRPLQAELRSVPSGGPAHARTSSGQGPQQ